MNPNADQPQCDHGHVMMHDLCPDCDANQGRPHAATTVRLIPPWTNRPYTRCTACQKAASHCVHRELT